MKAPKARSSAKARRRAPLTRDGIENAALDLIEEVGLEGFSTRKLGERLKCEAMSIYHHYPSKAHLLDALVDRVVAGAEIPSRNLDPVTRLRKLASGWRAMALAHPHFFPILSVHRMNSETGVAYLNEIVSTLRDAGLERERAARMFRSLGYFLTGAALDEISGYARGPSSMNPVSNERLAKDFPQIAAAGEFFSPAHFDKTFEFGLKLFLEQLPGSGRRRQRKSSN